MEDEGVVRDKRDLFMMTRGKTGGPSCFKQLQYVTCTKFYFLKNNTFH